MMTIGQFSERTGLRAKTLRYYEEIGLLAPTVRQDNGYRQYAEAQVEQAKLINSLRQAGVPIAGIRDFIGSGRDRREELLARWRKEMAVKQLSVQVASQYLSGIGSEGAGIKRVHLIYWDRPQTMVWFEAGHVNRPEEWEHALRLASDRLAAAGAVPETAGYIRFVEGNEGIRGQAGYVVQKNKVPAGGVLEHTSPTLFATMECNSRMAMPCRPIFSVIRDFGFQALGTPIRKYSDFQTGRYLLMVPVVQYLAHEEDQHV